MVKKLLIMFIIAVLLIVTTIPAVAEKPLDAGAKGNSSHTNQGKGNDADKPGASKNQGKANPVNPTTTSNKNTLMRNNTTNNTEAGFDDYGYNRTARIFNGTAWDWCMEKVGDEDWCLGYLGDNVHDKLIMKWNAEWDRGNDDDWSKPPYDAWENNQWNGKVPGGSGEVWHYKIVWVGTCREGAPFPDGGYCIWGQFEVLMDHGTMDGVHVWASHAVPSGYGSHP